MSGSVGVALGIIESLECYCIPQPGEFVVVFTDSNAQVAGLAEQAWSFTLSTVSWVDLRGRSFQRLVRPYVGDIVRVSEV